MGGFLVQQGATVMCSHGGQVQPTVVNTRVTIDGMATLLVTEPLTIAGCAGIPPNLPPCVTAQVLVGTERVTSTGQPLIVQSSTAICSPNGQPLLPPLVTQTRVTAM
jgi:hypothetical protein